MYREERRDKLLRQEEREERRSKEKEDKEKRLRKEREEKEERLRMEQKAEMEDRVIKDIESKELKVRDEIDLCFCRIETILISFPVPKTDLVEELRVNISKITDHVATFNYLAKKSDRIFDENIRKAEEYILSGNEKIELIMNEASRVQFEEKECDKVELAARKKQEESSMKEKEELLTQRLLIEIYALEDSLCDVQWVLVTQLEDRDLLNHEKDLSSLDKKFSCLSTKVTNLISQLPVGFLDRNRVLDKRSEKEKEVRRILDSYKQNLRTEIANRNVDEEKLWNTPSLKIKLEKFSGYNSVIDIYTFQVEFEKLYARRIEKKLLPDYLKNNYLKGTALTLVRTLEYLDEIWKRLKKLLEIQKCY